MKRWTGVILEIPENHIRGPLKINSDNKEISHDFNILAKLYLLIIEGKNNIM